MLKNFNRFNFFKNVINIFAMFKNISILLKTYDNSLGNIIYFWSKFEFWNSKFECSCFKILQTMRKFHPGFNLHLSCKSCILKLFISEKNQEEQSSSFYFFVIICADFRCRWKEDEQKHSSLNRDFVYKKRMHTLENLPRDFRHDISNDWYGSQEIWGV